MWKVLFDGKSLDAWRGYKSDTVPQGWKINDGVLTKDGRPADLISRDEFGDFELELEWKIAPGGNSGIFYRGSEEYDHIYWSAPEYQLLDDEKAEDNETRLTCAGAAYAIYPSPSGHLKPVGEFNATRIVARGAHVEQLAERLQAARIRALEPGLGSQGESEQVRTLCQLRPRETPALRDPGRP